MIEPNETDTDKKTKFYISINEHCLPKSTDSSKEYVATLWIASLVKNFMF